MTFSKILEEEKNIPTHVVAVFAFVEKNGKILLSKRSSKDPQAPGVWSVPGGKVESEEGENILLKTLKREVLEEVGINIEDDVKLFWNEGFRRISGHHVLGLSYLCKWKSGIAKPLEHQDEVRWFTKRQLENFPELPNYFRARVKKLLKFKE